MERGRWRTGLFFVLPCLLFFLVFVAYPIMLVAYLSFYDYSPLRSSEILFIGLGNYEWAVNSDIVWYSLYITIIFTLISVAIEFLVGLFLATMLAKLVRETTSRIGKIFTGTLSGVLILPLAIPAVVAAVAWKIMLHPQSGPINALLGVNIPWTTQYPLLSVIVADAWKMTPFILFILFAAIMSIPGEVYEAAKIDGVSGWQEFRYITFPLILPESAVAVAFRAIDAFTKIFDVVYVMTGGGPGVQTLVFPLLIWKVAFFHLYFGRASALAVIAIAVSAILGLILIVRGRAR